MILADFKVFPRTGRIMGIDWGSRRMGVAVSDASWNFIFTRPVITVTRGGKGMVQQVADLIDTEHVVGIVIGLPVHSDGSEGDTASMVRDFATQLEQYTNLPICFIEENLTSVTAQEQMGRVRISDIKERLDSESARVILENAMAMIQRL